MSLTTARKANLTIAVATVFLVIAQFARAEPPYEIVLVTASEDGSEDVFIEGVAGDSSNPWGAADTLCSDRSNVRAALGLPPKFTDGENNVLGVLGTVLGTIADNAAAAANPEGQATWNVYEEFCNSRGATASAKMVYTNCSMTMWSGGDLVRFVLPEGGGEAEMVVARTVRNFDKKGNCYGSHTTPPTVYTTQPNVDGCPEGWSVTGGYVTSIEATRVKLERLFKGDASEYVPTGTLEEKSAEERGGRAEHLGVPTREVTFSYKGSAMPQMMEGMKDLPFDVSMVSEGTAWVTDEAPGAHVVRNFYADFTSQVVPDDSSQTLLGGIIRHMGELTKYGLPLRVTQETSVRIEGMPAMAIPTLGQKSFSDTTVTGVGHFLSNAEWCAQTELPTDWKLVDFEDLMSSAGGAGEASSTNSGAAGNAGAVGPGDANQNSAPAGSQNAMSSITEAMQSMPPEQREMLEQYGMGGMMEQMTGAASAGTQQAAASTRAPGSGATVTGSNMPSSEELQADSVTESVQKHLQALGYNVGSVSGEMSMHTTIAISTFQAEKGMTVTGEVSPQLLGILSAEVDSRR